jgi:hypothetical protein
MHMAIVKKLCEEIVLQHEATVAHPFTPRGASSARTSWRTWPRRCAAAPPGIIALLALFSCHPKIRSTGRAWTVRSAAVLDRRDFGALSTPWYGRVSDSTNTERHMGGRQDAQAKLGGLSRAQQPPRVGLRMFSPRASVSYLGWGRELSTPHTVGCW